jgi:hypothetical protein
MTYDKLIEVKKRNPEETQLVQAGYNKLIQFKK